jgi:hypothetical protein
MSRPLNTSPLALLFALAAFVCSAVRAETFTPDEPVSPDGFEVVSDHDLTASNARVLKRGPGVFFVVPERDAREVRLTPASEAARTLKVGPPASTVTIALKGAAPVKNRDREAALEITVAQGQDSAPPVVRANVGRVERLERVGPGRYTAFYSLPATRYPEVAIIVAFSAWPHAQSIHGAFGVLRLPIASAVEVPGRAEAGAEVRLSIAGQSFGPVKAGPDGTFRLPVVVPPGFGVAQVQTVDRVGNRRSSSLDLLLPPTDQLSCVSTPAQLPADGASQARVLCAISDRYGSAARGSKVSLSASAGTLSSARDLSNGVAEWAWTAPTERGSGAVTFEASWRNLGFESREALSIALVQGPVAKVRIDDLDAVVHLGSTWRPEITATDSMGRPVKGAVIVAELPGGTVAGDPASATPLRWQPDGSPRTVDLTVRAWGPLGEAPARLLVWAEAKTLFAAITDLSGLPVPAQSILVDDRSVRSGADGIAPLGPLVDGVHQVRHAEWAALKTRVIVAAGALRFPVTDRPPRVEVPLPLRVAPPCEINVRLVRAGDHLTWWLEKPDGSLADDREVALTVDGVVTTVRSRGKAELSGRQVSVVDVATGVAAALGAAP